MGRIFFLSCLSLLFISCSRAPQKISEPTDQEKWAARLEQARKRNCSSGSEGVGIVSGNKLSSDSRIAKSTLMLVAKRKSGGSSTCTATLISPTVIMTAAHCLDSDLNEAFLVLSTDPICDYAQDKLRSVAIAKFNRHEEYIRLELENTKNKKSDGSDKYNSAMMSQFDVALAKLDKPLPAPYQPVALALDSDDEKYMQSTLYYGAGFGVTTGIGEEDTTDTMLNFAQFRLKMPNVNEIYLLDRWGFPLENMERDYYFIDQRQASGVCSGDSGGPLFRYMGFQLQQVGVASFVMTADRDIDPCHSTGVYLKISSKREWFQKTFQGLSPSEANPF